MDRSKLPEKPVVPRSGKTLAVIIAVLSFLVLMFLGARATDFGTIASALGLYSAGLLGVFGVLTSWRSTITRRKHRYLQVEDPWVEVINRAVNIALRGSVLAFSLMLFAVVAPAVKEQIYSLLIDRSIFDRSIYSIIATTSSSIAIAGVITLGLMSLQMVRDVNGVYAWNNYIEAEEAQRAEQKKRASGKQPYCLESCDD